MTYQCFGGKGCLANSVSLERDFSGEKSYYLHGLDGSAERDKERKLQESFNEQNDSVHMANYIREQYSTLVVGMVTFKNEQNSGQTKQSTSAGIGRYRRLGSNSGSFQPSAEAVWCIDRLRSLRQSSQFQSSSVLHQVQSDEGRRSRRVLTNLEGTSSELVLRAVQPNRQSGSTLHRIQGSDDSNSPSVENQMVVANNTGISCEQCGNECLRFCTYSKRSRRTLEEILEDRSNVDRLSIPTLMQIAESMIPHHNRMSTAVNYDSYWNRLIKFATKNKILPPPSSDLVVAFLSYLFLKTPSGSNCKSAMFAIRNRCKVFMLEDPTRHSKVQLLISSMCNLSWVHSKSVRHPWSLEFIKKWIGIGHRKVPYRTFVMYTCLMIIGLRSMFRGSELGSLLVEDIKSVTNPVIGFKITSRIVKNRKEGRTSSIEATGSDLCPLKWLHELLNCKKPGIYLFSGNNPMDTTEISWILRSVSQWIGIDGKFSSHSLRIGGASEAAFAGFSTAAIQAIGDWSSDAIDRYFRSEFVGNRNVSSQIGF